MTNILRAENAAVKEIEEIFTEAGWSDGWGLTDDEVRKAPSPIFYRNETPTVASEARVEANGQKHLLYCIYNVIDTDPKYAGNHPSHFDVTLALTFYYDDPFLFHEDSGAKKFIDALLAALAERLWVISGEGETNVPPSDDRQPYINRKILFVTNNF